MKTLFKGGSVVSGSGVKRCDLLIEDDKVKKVGRVFFGRIDREIDVTDCLLFPGFIDAHTHLIPSF